MMMMMMVVVKHNQSMAPPLDPGQGPTRTYFIAVYVFSSPEQRSSSFQDCKFWKKFQKYVTVDLVLRFLPPKFTRY